MKAREYQLLSECVAEPFDAAKLLEIAAKLRDRSERSVSDYRRVLRIAQDLHGCADPIMDSPIWERLSDELSECAAAHHAYEDSAICLPNVRVFDSVDDGTAMLQEWFPTADHVDELNFVLFSTSGVQGSYRTLEDVRLDWGVGDPNTHYVTFVVVSPRVLFLHCGNVWCRNQHAYAWLKSLCQASWDAVTGVGKAANESP